MNSREGNGPGEAARYNGFDWLRGFAALFIVAVHLSVGTTPAWTYISTFGSDVGIEIFAAISGFLLAILIDKSRDRQIGHLIIHRAKRLLPTYLMWTAAYLVALSLLDLAFGTPRGYLAGLSPCFIAKAVFRGSAEVHLWFVPCLFIASALLIIVDRIPWAKLRGGWAYLIGGVMIGFVGDYWETRFVHYDVRLFGWLMFGMGLSRLVRRSHASAALQRIRRGAALVVVPAMIAHVLLQNSIYWHAIDFIVVLTLLLALSAPSIPSSRVASFLSRTSLSVYYVHLLIARLFSVAIRANHLEPLNMVHSLGLWALVWLTSLAIIALWDVMRKRCA